MSNLLELNLTPKEAAERIAELAQNERLVRRSIDARRRGDIRVMLTVERGELEAVGAGFTSQDVSGAREVIIVGAGPAGLFAALELIEQGVRPIVLERGKNVHDRKVDVATINRGGVVDADSNYCFGEGGAGTFSDGKLYTRSKKRGDNRRILEILHSHGADQSILWEAHPHIGTDKLPMVIEAIRKSIEQAGGEVRFGARVSDLILDGDKIKGVELACGEQVMADAVILATGHSARDIYELLERKGVEMEAKNFAVGVRVEHPQPMIDRIQYKAERGDYLPAAAYNLVAQAKGRGVYSFCMCPGGFIVPAATAAGEIVVNGMSASGRNNHFANAGIVTEVRAEDIADFTEHYGVLGGMRFCQQLEQMAYTQAGAAGGKAPAQKLTEFVNARPASKTLETSYHPGVTPSDMHRWLPKFVGKALQEGFVQFNNKMHGFISEEAQILGVESRTSSPVRIPRSRETFMHTRVEGLYPAGEGAGFAGGILSSAVDGMLCATAAALYIK